MVKTLAFLALLLGIAAASQVLGGAEESIAKAANSDPLVAEALGDLNLGKASRLAETEVSQEDLEAAKPVSVEEHHLSFSETTSIHEDIDALLSDETEQDIESSKTGDEVLDFRGVLAAAIQEAQNPQKLEVGHINECRGVVTFLQKRDDEEDRKQKKEIMLIELVREQLDKLNKIGHKGLTEDLVTKIISTLDVGRDYAMVNGENGIFTMLKKLEDRMVAQLKEMRRKTKVQRDWCETNCRQKYDLLTAQFKKATHLLAEARRLLKHYLDSFQEHRGLYEAMIKEYKRMMEIHDEEEMVRSQELALLSVLRMKAAKYIKIHITECKDPKDECNKALEEKSQQMLADIALFDGVRAEQVEDLTASLARPHTNMLEIDRMLGNIVDKILEERAESWRKLNAKNALIVKKRALLASLEEKVNIARQEVAKALVYYKQTAAALADVREWCAGFMDEE